MTQKPFRRVMKPYGLRGEDGYLILELAGDWTGDACFEQFPAHVRRAVREAPQIKCGIHLEALLSSGHFGGDVFKAVKDDVDCLLATRILVERYPMDPMTKAAVLAFPDFGGGARSPLDEMIADTVLEPLSLRDDEEELSL